jgi:hypothetical protein
MCQQALIARRIQADSDAKVGEQATFRRFFLAYSLYACPNRQNRSSRGHRMYRAGVSLANILFRQQLGAGNVYAFVIGWP